MSLYSLNPQKLELAKRIMRDAPCKCEVCFAEAYLFGQKSRHGARCLAIAAVEGRKKEADGYRTVEKAALQAGRPAIQEQFEELGGRMAEELVGNAAIQEGI